MAHSKAVLDPVVRIKRKILTGLQGRGLSTEITGWLAGWLVGWLVATFWLVMSEG